MSTLALVLGLVVGVILLVRLIFVGLVVAGLFFAAISCVQWMGEGDKKERASWYVADRGDERDRGGRVPPELVGIWEGDVAGGRGGPSKVYVVLPAGRVGGVVAYLRFTTDDRECVEQARLVAVYERAVVLDGERFLGTHQYDCTRPDEPVELRATLPPGSYLEHHLGNDGRRGFLSRVRPSGPTPPARALGGRWRGRFSCNGEPAGLDLRLRAVSTNRLVAVFRSFPVERGGWVGPGSFTMQGAYVNGHLTLHADKWITGPDNGVFVDLSADIRGAAPRTITGWFTDWQRECTRFTIKRAVR